MMAGHMSAKSTLEVEAPIRIAPPALDITEERELSERTIVRESRPLSALTLVLVALGAAILLLVPYLILVHMLSL